MEYVYVLLGDRWHIPPWVIEEAPADRVQFYIALLNKEGEYKGALEGLGPADHFDWGDE